MVLIEGTGHAGVGAVIGLSNARVAEMLEAPVVIVSEGGVGRPIDEIVLNHALFERHRVRVLGAVVNKVNVEANPDLPEVLRPGPGPARDRAARLHPVQRAAGQPVAGADHHPPGRRPAGRRGDGGRHHRPRGHRRHAGRPRGALPARSDAAHHPRRPRGHAGRGAGGVPGGDRAGPPATGDRHRPDRRIPAVGRLGGRAARRPASSPTWSRPTPIGPPRTCRTSWSRPIPPTPRRSPPSRSWSADRSIRSRCSPAFEARRTMPA